MYDPEEKDFMDYEEEMDEELSPQEIAGIEGASWVQDDCFENYS